MSDVVTVVLGVILVLYVLASFDDLVFDVVYWLSRRTLRASNVPVWALRLDRPKRLAVLVPAWREAGVVGPMLRATLRLMHYPAGNVDFFVGVYPNDEATVLDVEPLTREYPNVHVIVNPRPGPTNKSQNLNVLYEAVEAFEEARGTRFEAIAVHDAEDVIHPYTFKLYSVLLNAYHAVQLPVFALREHLGWRGVLGTLISRTYADEFAQRHLHEMPVREHLGLFVPGAGTGFAVEREVLAWLRLQGPIFNESSLTEDYELTWRLWRERYKVHFHVQRVVRVDDTGRASTDIVAVRERFPTNFGAAVRQKGRWTYGISMQTPTTARWRELSGWDKLTLWHDRKGKYTNLLHVVGYPAAAYATLAEPLGWPAGAPGVLVPLSVTVMALTTERLVMRFCAVREVYGTGEALLATFAPPLVPLRWFVGTVINLAAALRAWRLYWRPTAGAARGAPPRWDKTERHGYAPPAVLRRTRRRLGDLLLFYGDVSWQAVARAVTAGRKDGAGVRLGERLIAQGSIDPRQLQHRLADQLQVAYVNLEHHPPDFSLLSADIARQWHLVPLEQSASGIVVATPLALDTGAWAHVERELFVRFGLHVIPRMADAESVRAALEQAVDRAPVPAEPGAASREPS